MGVGLVLLPPQVLNLLLLSSPQIEGRLMKRLYFLLYLFVCAFLWRGLCAMSIIKTVINKSYLQMSGFCLVSLLVSAILN